MIEQPKLLLLHFRAAAITCGSLPVAIYTSVIVNIQFKSCSNVCETLVDFISPKSTKIPSYNRRC